MAAFGTLHVVCPGCGHDVEVIIKSRTSPVQEVGGRLTLEIWPELDHECPPSPERAAV